MSEFRSYSALVVGSGCAGLAAACRLAEAGVRTALLTEGMTLGTSRNTGSDKQTYYKLSLSGSEPDSPRAMADDLFAGGAVDGDCALSEAALSPRAFSDLVSLGVPFPHNAYGEYVGYKTDHDPRARATSAGPLTSRFMTEALGRRLRELPVDVFDGFRVLEILKTGNKTAGVLALDLKTEKTIAFRAPDVILATGGPAGIYADSVYPESQTGSTSLAILAGAQLSNLTEWQFGLSSVSPRWNVSGTYFQVLPRLFSRDGNGTEREFLTEIIKDPGEALGLLFLKGYQWPFDSGRVADGSSIVDIAVYRETVLRGREVYLDYTQNPFGLGAIDPDILPTEARDYLAGADAFLPTPWERLEKMNAPALDFYEKRGVDLRREPLRIALCVQHHNGGIAVDGRWRTNVPGLFAIGECAGTHGVRRPGGSALNAGQVGALRAAEYISVRGGDPCPEEEFSAIAETAGRAYSSLADKDAPGIDADPMIKAARRRMSDCAGAIRDPGKMKAALLAAEEDEKTVRAASFKGANGTAKYSVLLDVLITQRAVLAAMIDYAARSGGSRGSALYTDPSGELRDGLEEIFRMSPEDEKLRGFVQTVEMRGDGFAVWWRPVRKIPPEDGFFENVWRGYRENKNVK
ncbi:MAG: FAD-binding protein [Clostridia bacterium]|nr:FAD-binding protein [Clostridia bacterium]